MSYVELHTHSYYSFLEGASSPQEIVGAAKELGYKAIALTDSCGLYGAIPFYQEAKILGIKPIIGALMEVVSGESIILLCRNLRGYSNLSELITRSRAGQQKGQYKTLRKDIEELSENLICLIGGKDGSISKILSHNQEQKALDILKFYRETFDSESLYMELTQHLEYGNQIYLQKLMDLAQQFSIPFVATNAIRYHSEEKAHLSDVISCIREKVLLKNSYNARSGNHERRLKTPMEMKELFQGIPSAIENTIKIANQCHIELEFSAYRFPEYPIPKGYNLHTYLKELCLQALPRKIQHHQGSYQIGRAHV